MAPLLLIAALCIVDWRGHLRHRDAKAQSLVNDVADAHRLLEPDL